MAAAGAQEEIAGMESGSDSEGASAEVDIDELIFSFDNEPNWMFGEQ